MEEARRIRKKSLLLALMFFQNVIALQTQFFLIPHMPAAGPVVNDVAHTPLHRTKTKYLGSWKGSYFESLSLLHLAMRQSWRPGCNVTSATDRAERKTKQARSEQLSSYWNCFQFLYCSLKWIMSTIYIGTTPKCWVQVCIVWIFLIISAVLHGSRSRIFCIKTSLGLLKIADVRSLWINNASGIRDLQKHSVRSGYIFNDGTTTSWEPPTENIS